MMKRFATVLLSLLLALSLAACGGGDPSDNTGGASNGSSAPSGGTDTPELPAGGGYHEGGPEEAMSTYWFDFTVHSAYVCQTFGGYTAGEGNRLVVASLTVKNVRDFTVDMYREDFQIEWDDETGGDFALALSQKSVAAESVLPDEYVLAAGEEREGVLVYEVPDTDSLDYYITFLEVFDDGTEEGKEGDTFVVCITADNGGVRL